MSYMRFVCLLVTTLTTAAVLMTVAQSPTLQAGVSVKLAVSANAAPMPDADNENAFIVTVTDDGNVYLGIDRIKLPDLKEKVRSTPFQRGQKVYIKADARTPYAKVLEVLDATGTGGIAPAGSADGPHRTVDDREQSCRRKAWKCGGWDVDSILDRICGRAGRISRP